MLRPTLLELDPESRELYARFVPAAHPLRRLDAALDFSFILPLVAGRYCPDRGRPAIHPERLWRLLFVQYYLKLSDEKVALAARESLAVRWFARLRLGDAAPHATTLQKFRANRLDEDAYLRIHAALLRQAEGLALLDGAERQIFDTSHVRSDTRVMPLTSLLLAARRQLVRAVAAVDAAFGAELAAQMEADRAAYKADRARRQAEGAPRRTKAERIAATVAVVGRTLAVVLERVADERLVRTERLRRALWVLEKVIADRQVGASDRLVSIHDIEARKGKKGFGPWDGRKLGITVQEESRLVTGALMAPANWNDDALLPPVLDQQRAQLGLVPPELTADLGLDRPTLREDLQRRRIVAHIPKTPTRNREGRGLFTVDDFAFDPVARTLTCPAGQRAPAHRRHVPAASRDQLRVQRPGLPRLPAQATLLPARHRAGPGTHGPRQRRLGRALGRAAAHGLARLPRGVRKARPGGGEDLGAGLPRRPPLPLPGRPAQPDTASRYRDGGERQAHRPTAGGAHGPRPPSAPVPLDPAPMPGSTMTAAPTGRQAFSAAWYGKSRDPRAARYTDRQFTGQTEDGSIELYWYQSRAYEPLLGRFVQPDSIVPAPKDPQSLNRYSYVRNNPLSRVDPTGHYDLTTQLGRWEWRQAHSGWVLGDDDHTGRLTALDPKGNIYDLGIGLKYGGRTGDAIIGTMVAPGIETPAGTKQWDYIAHGVIVRNEVSGPGFIPYARLGPAGGYTVEDRGQFVKGFNAGNDNTMVVVRNEIWSTVTVEMNSALLAHELGHVVQLRERGQEKYLEDYVGAAPWATILSVPLGPLGVTAHDLHPMEIDANVQAGLPWNWNGITPPGWQFRLPRRWSP